MVSAAPGWYPDSTGRFVTRYWDGTVWTPWVFDAAGRQFPDPLTPAPAPAAAPAPAPSPRLLELEALKARLDEAEAGYGRLIAHARATRMAPRDFQKEAVKVGLVVRDGDVWFYVLTADTWFRYDGVTLRPLGGWDDGPVSSAAPAQSTTAPAPAGSPSPQGAG